MKILHIDELTDICGYFTTETTVNNCYGCTHPDQEETDIDFRTGKEHGKCYSWACPLANEADLEDMKQLDPQLYNEWKGEEYCPTEMGAQYLVVEDDVTEQPQS